jgi:hypothetical protein
MISPHLLRLPEAHTSKHERFGVRAWGRARVRCCIGGEAGNTFVMQLLHRPLFKKTTFLWSKFNSLQLTLCPY